MKAMLLSWFICFVLSVIMKLTGKMWKNKNLLKCYRKEYPWWLYGFAIVYCGFFISGIINTFKFIISL